MRAVLAVSLVALLCPLAVLAQTAPPASTAPAPSAAPASPSAAPASPGPTSTRGGDITRDEYIQHAVDRARRAAETRFDRMDTNHDGILTADERRAARATRRGASQQ
jgi:hypothetical protein